MRSGDAIRCASGKPQPAIVACTNIVNDKHESDEARAIALRNRAYQFQQAGDPDHAIADYTAALDRPEPSATLAKIRLNRGALYIQKGEEPAALEDLGKALALDPKLKSAYVTRASILAKRGDDPEALDDLNHAVLLDPNDAAAYIARGSLYSHRGDQSQAIADFSRAIAIDPNNAIAWRDRGFAHRESGENSAAEADAAEAIRLNPDLASAHFDLGLSLAAPGRTARTKGR